MNSTHAFWQWYQNGDLTPQIPDSFWYVKGSNVGSVPDLHVTKEAVFASNERGRRAALFNEAAIKNRHITSGGEH